MRVLIKLKGNWSPNGTDEDECYTYYADKDKIYLQDNDYGLNKRWYPIENIARVDTSKNG